MIKISHRGNIYGPEPSKENNPNYIYETLQKNYDCEIDLWLVDKKIFLGHDKPDFEIPLSFLIDHMNALWIHCKNLEILDFMVAMAKEGNSFNFFWHQKDNFTLTSKLFIWTYPGQQIQKFSIIVNLGLPNNFRAANSFAGVCSDYIAYY
jgi:hypothetical protein